MGVGKSPHTNERETRMPFSQVLAAVALMVLAGGVYLMLSTLFSGGRTSTSD
jgi:hypothetical protein